MRCRVDHHLATIGKDLAGERINLGDALYLIAKELEPQDRLFTGRLHLERIATHAKLRSAERRIIALILQINKVTQDRITAILAALPDTEDRGAVINWRTEAIDAGDRGNDDRVATLKERLGRRVA